MKHVFTSDSEIAHIWAHQLQDSAQKAGTNNFYFEGDTIYSYGGHFPIAKIVKRKGHPITVLFTTRGYSNTTAGHIATVRGACSHLPKVYCQTPEGRFREDELKHFKYLMEGEFAKLAKARKPELYVNSIASIQAQAVAYCKFWGKRVPAFFTKTGNVEQLQEKYKAQLANEEARKARLIALGAKIQARTLIAWKQGPEAHTELAKSLSDKEKTAERAFSATQPNLSHLRLLNASEIETSKGYKIPKDVALRFYHSILRQGKALIGTKFMEFNIDGLNGSLRIGCHDIPIQEVHEMGQLLEGGKA